MTIRRREFITLLGGAAAWPMTARAQQRLPTVGYLSSSTPVNPTRLTELRKGLNTEGYFEGQNVTIEFHTAERYDQLTALAADFVRRKVAVIFADGLPAALAAKAATATIPIVFFTGSDPVKEGLVTNLNRPTGNLTGVTNFSGTLIGKRLELLRELVPTAAVIGVLVNPNNQNVETRLKDIREAAQAIGQQIDILEAGSEREIDTGFDTFVKRRVAALLVSDDPLFSARMEQLVALVTRHRVPAISFSSGFVPAGGLVSYTSQLSDTNHQIAIYIGRILKGDKPADLPVVQPTKFELVINLQTARALGITVPPNLLATADEVIE
jgi:putative ABC transport system substrate-binding protein